MWDGLPQVVALRAAQLATAPSRVVQRMRGTEEWVAAEVSRNHAGGGVRGPPFNVGHGAGLLKTELGLRRVRCRRTRSQRLPFCANNICPNNGK